MTRESFITHFGHEVMGMVTEAAMMGRDGKLILSFIKAMDQRVKQVLGKAWDDASAPTNGKPANGPMATKGR